MLREIKKISQKRGQPRRRWFADSEVDLFVWLDDQDEIVSYQLTYDKPHAEKALLWDKETGFSHLGVDDGFNPGKHPGSPLFVEDGSVKPAKIIAIIEKHAGELDPAIKSFIITGIEDRLG